MPFFCVSSDLTTGRIHDHRDGKLWRALRASVALPGILPPVTHHGHLLVDGGVMNNLPVDVMREQAIGAGPDHRLRHHRRDRSAGARRPLWRAALVVADRPAHARQPLASSPS